MKQSSGLVCVWLCGCVSLCVSVLHCFALSPALHDALHVSRSAFTDFVDQRSSCSQDPMNVIDVLAIAPFYIRLVVTSTMELSAEQLRVRNQ